MMPRVMKALRYAGYPLFYVFALLLCAYFTFPYERLKDRLESEVNARQVAGNARISIGSMEPYWFSGIEAKDVRLAPARPASDEKPKPAPIVFDEVHARVSMLRFLVGITHLSFGAEASGGTVSGYTSDGGDARTLEAEFESLKLSDIPQLAEMIGLPIGGLLTGTVELKLPEGKLAKGEGKIALKITDLSIGDGKAKIKNAIALPELNAGELVFESEATDGKLEIGKFSANGRDIEVVSDGRIRLRDPASASLAELNLRFKFTPAYTGRNETTRALFGGPGAPAMFDLDPKVRRSKRPDGFYVWRVTGPLANVSFQPAAMAGPAAPAGLATPPAGFAEDSEQDSE